MTNEHDPSDDLLADIDLHEWHVPPLLPVDRASLLTRALSPAAAPARRPRLAWIVAAIVVVNALIATLLVIVLARPPAAQTVVRVQPAGGGSVDAQVRDLLQRLEQEQRELEHKLAEIQELRALVVELSDKVRLYEQRDHQSPKHDRQPPAPVPLDHQPVDPYEADTTCDEVSCVLQNYPNGCCEKFKKLPAPKPSNDLPEALDRTSISNGIASVKSRISECSTRSAAKGVVKVRVRVAPDGRVTNVVIDATPDPVLAACVASAVQRAVFMRTQQGGSFSYPFVF